MKTLASVLAVLLASSLSGCYWQTKPPSEIAPAPDATERTMRVTTLDSATFRVEAASVDRGTFIGATDTGSVRVPVDSIAMIEARNTLLGGLPIILLGLGGTATFLSIAL